MNKNSKSTNKKIGLMLFIVVVTLILSFNFFKNYPNNNELKYCEIANINTEKSICYQKINLTNAPQKGSISFTDIEVMNNSQLKKLLLGK